MKRFIATLIAFTLILSVLMTSVSASSATYTNAAEIAQLVDDGYNQGTKGPVTITKGTLKTTFSSKTVYLITLSGTEWVFNQSTEALTDLFTGFNLQNSYYYNVVNIISANVPKGSNLILAGHSLGGMIAQQVAADTTIKRNYNILNTVTFGSPLLSNGSREGTVRRLGDVSDIVPLLSVQTILSPLRALAGLNREDGGYYLQPITAHTECYTRTDVWGKYDVTGTKYGSAKLILDLSTRTFFKSPIF
jgi:hypothetical protein